MTISAILLKLIDEILFHVADPDIGSRISNFRESLLVAGFGSMEEVCDKSIAPLT